MWEENADFLKKVHPTTELRALEQEKMKTQKSKVKKLY